MRGRVSDSLQSVHPTPARAGPHPPSLPPGAHGCSLCVCTRSIPLDECQTWFKSQQRRQHSGQQWVRPLPSLHLRNHLNAAKTALLGDANLLCFYCWFKERKPNCDRQSVHNQQFQPTMWMAWHAVGSFTQLPWRPQAFIIDNYTTFHFIDFSQ